MASLTPGIASRRFTCYIASDSVALRLWAKQPGKWYLMGLRVAIPDPSRGKTLGRKVLSEEEKRRLKNGEEIDRVVTPVDRPECETCSEPARQIPASPQPKIG
jgi:hypothetical protein